MSTRTRSGVDSATTGAPRRVVVGMSASALMVVLSLVAAGVLAGHIDDLTRTIEDSNTVFGWTNEPAVERALATDPDIARYRMWRSLALATTGISAAGMLFFFVAGLLDRRRRMTLASETASDFKKQKAEEIRGFISRHIDTLAQKKVELMAANEYGVVDDTKWHGELTYFINRVLRPGCGVDAELFTFVELKALVEKQISMLG